ncbi:histidine triad nucleotide-binding protein [Sulfurivermis fontis]|uniref:histidine triad nucleotide-binding protein n=1 Tax=Sulfurivermis fontis TaxID=1972068 RepID=UPI000FDC53EF|nr:histidine triad nucleotide-binding protein [Sulfurivermis fontis]
MNCIFCKIAAGEIPATIVHQDEHVVAFRDLNPQAPTHILIIPRRHIATVNDLAEADAATVGRLFLAARRIAAELGFAADGYRLVMNTNAAAGQTVFHIHLHLLAGRNFAWPPG